MRKGSRLSRFTEDDGFTPLGEKYFRARDELKGRLFRRYWRRRWERGLANQSDRPA